MRLFVKWLSDDKRERQRETERHTQRERHTTHTTKETSFVEPIPADLDPRGRGARVQDAGQGDPWSQRLLCVGLQRNGDDQRLGRRDDDARGVAPCEAVPAGRPLCQMAVGRAER